MVLPFELTRKGRRLHAGENTENGSTCIVTMDLEWVQDGQFLSSLRGGRAHKCADVTDTNDPYQEIRNFPQTSRHPLCVLSPRVCTEKVRSS